MIANFKKKQKGGGGLFENDYFFIFGAILCGLIFLAFVVADIKIYHRKQKLDQQLAALRVQIEQIKKSNQQLEEGIIKSEDPDYLEKIAREQLDMQKDGEKVVSFIIPDQSKKLDSQNQGQNWFGNLWQKLLGVFKF